MAQRVFFKSAGAKRCGICHVVTRNVIRRKDLGKNIGAAFFICDACIRFIKGIELEGEKQPELELPFVPDDDLETTGIIMRHSGFEDDKTDNIPPNEDKPAPTDPAKMQFFSLKKYAKEHGVDVEVYKTKSEILEQLQKTGE